MMRRIIVLTATAIAGCAGVPNYGPPLRSECIDTGEVASFTIMIREPGRIQDLFAQTPHVSTVDSKFVGGFTGFNANGQMTIVLPPLRGQRDHERLTVWGHELAHVVCGHFHNP